MKQLRLLIAEKIIDMGFSLMPKGREKNLMNKCLTTYAIVIEQQLRKELKEKGKI